MAKMLKAYEVILKNSDGINERCVPGYSKKDVEMKCKVSGEVIRVKPVPEVMPDADKVVDAMKKAGFPDVQCDLVGEILTSYVARAESADEDADTE